MKFQHRKFLKRIKFLTSCAIELLGYKLPGYCVTKLLGYSDNELLGDCVYYLISSYLVEESFR